MVESPDLQRLRSYSKKAYNAPVQSRANTSISSTSSSDIASPMSKGKLQEAKDANAQESPSRVKVGGFSALGKKMRSFSSGTKKEPPNEKEKIAQHAVKVEYPSSQLKMRSFSSDAEKNNSKEKAKEVQQGEKIEFPSNQSRTSLNEEAKKSKRTLSFFNTFSGRQKNGLIVSLESPPEDFLARKEVVKDGKAISPSRRPRLSMPGFSPTLTKAPIQSPFELTTSPQSLEDGGSPGDFNLKAFRNVRRQSSYFSYNVAEDPKKNNHGASSPPRSSANQYVPSPSLMSNEEAYKTGAAISASTSPRLELLGNGASFPFEHSLFDSKANSLTPDGSRSQGGSISAGKFRRVTASSRLCEEDGGNSTPGSVTKRESLIFSDTLARHGRPGSPFMNLSANQVEAFVAAENERRTTPLNRSVQESEEGGHASPHQSEGRSSIRAPSISMISENFHPPEKNQEENQDENEDENEKQEGDDKIVHEYLSPRLYPSEDLKRRRRVSRLPWLRDESKERPLSFCSATSSNDETTAHSGLIETLSSSDDHSKALAYDELQSSDMPAAASMLGHSLLNQTATSTFDHEPADTQKMLLSSANDLQASHSASSHMNHDRDGSSSNQHDSDGVHASNNKHHKGGSSVPLDFNSSSLSLPSVLHHQMSAETLVQSSTTSSLHSRVLDLLSFHDKQAPLLSAAQSRAEIHPTFSNRIAWPTPACVQVDYFATLSAINQHSLYEQHCKAADHAMSEYLRLMANFVPPEVMKQPEIIFPSTANRAYQNQDDGSRTRSVSLNGAQIGRRRGSAGVALTKVPVPPMPSNEVLEKLEAIVHHGQTNGYSSMRRKSDTIASSRHKGSHSSPSDRAKISRYPSAKFMASQRVDTLPIDAFGCNHPIMKANSTEN